MLYKLFPKKVTAVTKSNHDKVMKSFENPKSVEEIIIPLNSIKICDNEMDQS